MKVFIKGKGEVTLTQKDFIAAGGQGSVYGKSGIAYKIYAEPKHMLPVAKVQELSVLKNKYIIKPEDILLDEKSKIIGYTMPLVKNTYALCQLFPKAFRQRENLTHTQMFELIKKLQDIVKHCHDNKILIVDLNEMNFLADEKFTNIFAIDTDSYQTPSFPATALMESVRDRHAKPNHFDEGTDWFSFAITSFQMFIGIHPYKGKHPSIKDMDERMLKNISVLHNDVSIPPVCYDLKTIPPNYMKWYEAVLANGKRLPPPFGTEFVQLIAAKIKTIVGNNKFDINEIKEFTDAVMSYMTFAGIDLTLTETKVIINNKEFERNGYKYVGISPKKNHAILAKSENDKLKLFDVTAQTETVCDVIAEQVMSYNGIIYAKNGGNIVEIGFLETGKDIVPTSTTVAQTMDNATTFFDGVIFQNMLNTHFATIFPEKGLTYLIKIKELSNYVKILDAKYDNKVLFIAAIQKAGKIDMLMLRFDSKFDEYDLRKHENITFTGINFIVMANGVCVCINPQDQIELFANTINSQSVKVIDDPIINSDMRLYKDGTKVLFASDKKLYSFKMK
jgi:serine/threonine protein kinase